MTQPAKLIGTLVIAFRDIIEAFKAGDDYSFEGPVLNNALKHGTLRGKIHLTPLNKDHMLLKDRRTYTNLKVC